MLLSCCLQFSLLHLCALKAVISVCAATTCSYHLHLSLSCMLFTCLLSVQLFVSTAGVGRMAMAVFMQCPLALDIGCRRRALSLFCP
jgi:hypothetical protein